MLGATDTTKSPEVAPVGIAMVIDVALQELIVVATPCSNTVLLPCVVPKFSPLMTT
jgi:hypothetical protein